MTAESVLFAGVSAFFAVCATVYGWWAAETVGTVVLVIAFLMAGLVSLALVRRHHRTGTLPQGRKEAEVHESVGPVAFFPPRSAFPVLAAVGTALLGLGMVYGLWLFLIGVGLLAPGVYGFVFQYGDRGTGTGATH